MSYSVSILRSAQKELAKLPSSIYKKIRDVIYSLASNPRPVGSKKLIARPAWRVRIGRYRVIYEINDKEKSVLILHLGHRKDVY